MSFPAPEAEEARRASCWPGHLLTPHRTGEVSGKFFQMLTQGRHKSCGNTATCWPHVLPNWLLEEKGEFLRCQVMVSTSTRDSENTGVGKQQQRQQRGPAPASRGVSSKPDTVLLSCSQPHMLASSPGSLLTTCAPIHSQARVASRRKAGTPCSVQMQTHCGRPK